jgi:hypothetical protein
MHAGAVLQRGDAQAEDEQDGRLLGVQGQGWRKHLTVLRLPRQGAYSSPPA